MAVEVIVLGNDETDVEPPIVSPGAGPEGFFSRQEFPLSRGTEGGALATARGKLSTGRYRCGDEQQHQQKGEGRVHEAAAVFPLSTG